MIALLVLLPLHYEQLYQFRTVIAKEWKIITALGLTGIAAFHICVYISLKSTTPINALIILSTSPMVIVFGAWAFLKEHIEVSQIIGILISLLGAVILISHGRPFELLNFEFNKGDIWMLLAVPLWAAYSILLKRRPPGLPQIALLTSSVLAGVLLMVPIYFCSLSMGQQLSLNYVNVLSVLYISFFASVLAFRFWNRGVASIGPVKAGMYLHLMPFFGAFLSFWFLGEGLTRFHIIGGVFVFAGIAFTNPAGPRRCV